MVDPGPVYCDAFGVLNMDSLPRNLYEVQDSTYLPWSTEVCEALETPYRSQCLTDRLCTFTDTANAPSVRTSYRDSDILVRFGIAVAE